MFDVSPQVTLCICDMNEESADYLLMSCAAARTIVADCMWPVLA